MTTSKPNHYLLLKLAVVFLTRWPVKIKQQVEDQMLNAATGYFALVGLLVAAVSALFLLMAQTGLPNNIAVVIAMIASLVFTGAFHEDGLADTADGLGGGWTVEAKLNIMKDSRIGTYGASALLLALLLKYQLLVALVNVSTFVVIAALFLAHSLSRAFAVSVIGALEYVQLDKASKTKPVAESVSANSKKVLLFTSLFVLTLAWLSGFLTLFQIGIVIAGLVLVRHILISFIKKQLGGYTGDVLGAFQQVFELSIYIALLVVVGS